MFDAKVLQPMCAEKINFDILAGINRYDRNNPKLNKFYALDKCLPSIDNDMSQTLYIDKE